ncbi:MAG TPA: MBL fold metallo-hydrolase [Stellaceae bacterium]|jgi:flavorubredoxin|nr:MBL fold metallo-hydrolase [Stellaceae bacterium]
MTTTIDEIADAIYRISTAVEIPGASGFSFNQYLIVDDAPLLFHTGLRHQFPAVRDAIATVLPVERLRYLAFSHFEADECGALNQFLAAAPAAEPLCGQIAAMVSINDYADRAPRGLSDGEVVGLGRHSVRWLDAAHLPHAWECGYMMEAETATLLCGDLFTQGGSDLPPLTESDILGPSEAFRRQLDYYAHAKDTRAKLERLAAFAPTTLACMHGSAWRGDGAALLRALGDSIERS